MQNDKFEIKEKVWIWDGPSPWYFVTIPQKESSYIRREYRDRHRGWGSIPVEVTIEESVFKTSIFWEKKGTYLLPIKKSVRTAENLKNGSIAVLKITLKP